MALSTNTARSVTPESREASAERFKRKLLGEHAKYKNRALEIQLNDQSKRVLRDLAEYFGMAWLSEQVGLAPITLYRVLAGFQESCRPESKKRLKEFLVGYDR